jgi:hypothetical protein
MHDVMASSEFGLELANIDVSPNKIASLFVKTIRFWQTKWAAVSVFVLSPRIFNPVSGFWHNVTRAFGQDCSLSREESAFTTATPSLRFRSVASFEDYLNLG